MFVRVALYFIIQLSLLVDIKTKKLTQCEKTQHKCPSGMCLANQSMCASSLVCPKDMKACNQFTCTKSEEAFKCLGDRCEDGVTSCPDGSCANSQEECVTMVSCPRTISDLSVRCHDNACVANIEECTKYIKCPSFIPVRCPTGDCRINFNDCPSISRCPPSFPIKCNDGSCRMTNQECELSSLQTRCPDTSMVRCADGSCTQSKFLCPTLKTCPAKWVLCWNGLCAENLGKCKDPESGKSNSCSNNKMVKCEFSDTCREKLEQCPTPLICPTSTPVKCWDASCKESIDKCPPYQKCPKSLKECPDGTCTFETESCGTHITCSLEAPYRCYDNTCRTNPEDCNAMPQCEGNNPILCWNGVCVKNRSDCLPPEKCGDSEPIKCPNNTCKKSIDECKKTSQCPLGFIRCPDLSCKQRFSECLEEKCPVNFPVKCPDGQCSNDLKYCLKENGCPAFFPIRCTGNGEGKCVNNKSDCPQNPGCTDTKERWCDDGSCLPKTIPCPLSNGCPSTQPLLCADGTCIDPNKTKCHIAKCPKETPIKCLGGICATTINNCPTSSKREGDETCKNGTILCEDGTCVKSLEQCNPVFNCPTGYERCDNGSCRVSKEYCPKVKTCPAKKKYRCDNGACSEKKENCINIRGCPAYAPIKCTSNGACLSDSFRCKNIDILHPLANGCKSDSPLKCDNGKCVSDLKNCEETKCKDPEKKIFCSNTGQCAKSMRECSKLTDICPYKQIRCPDNTCKSDYMKCNNKYGCPLDKPFRCADGSCKKTSSDFNSLNVNDNCDSSIACPSYQPYLCADGSCAKKKAFCNVLLPCPTTTPVRCFDRTCAKTLNDCARGEVTCPAQNPILCSSGNCVKTIFDCKKGSQSCKYTHPFYCIDNTCQDTPSKCIFKNDIVKNNKGAKKLAQCPEGQFICGDGSCRKEISNCPIFPGCSNTWNPYKCPDGSCRSSKDQCALTEIKCNDGEKLCEDAICRTTCGDYNGCPFKTPLQCPNGFCVNTLSECAGKSNCPLENPFQCSNGACVASITDCYTPVRSFSFDDILIFTYSNGEVVADTILGYNNDIISRINIAANSFKNITEGSKNESINTAVKYRAVPQSKLIDTYHYYNHTRNLDVVAQLPLADPEEENKLEYQYTVLSPVFNISGTDDYVEFINPVLTILSFDFPVVVDDYSRKNITGLNPYKDVCLGKLEDKEWKCIDGEFTVNKYRNYILSVGFKEFGIYAVILHPKPDMTLIETVENGFIKYSIIILSCTLVGLVLFFGGSYAFMRIYRYRGKYKETYDKKKNKEKKIIELSNVNTNVIGQTLGDNLDNIIFTNNPSYKVEKFETKSNRTMELENLQESIQKRYRTLEGNHALLEKAKATSENELKRIKEYHTNLLTNPSLKPQFKRNSNV